MKERDIVRKIRIEILNKYGVRLHKNTGGPYSEAGAADLYGTLPGGRAIFVEVKAPGKKPRPNQLAWLEHEREMGALAVWVSSWEELLSVLDVDNRPLDG